MLDLRPLLKKWSMYSNKTDPQELSCIDRTILHFHLSTEMKGLLSEQYTPRKAKTVYFHVSMYF